MKICFPVQQDKGIESHVFNHFGSAPMFVIVDTETNVVDSVHNGDQHHAHGACDPLKALDGRKIDAVVVGGIGAGALGKLIRNGIAVYQAQAGTIRDNIEALAEKDLPEFKQQGCCGGHHHGDGCAH
jgi:predicted Fe-Mo cluster-binding NifX family protein